MKLLKVVLMSTLTTFATMSQAQELEGQQAVDLITKSEIIFSRIATSGSTRTKVVEIVLHRRNQIWICTLFVELINAASCRQFTP